MQETYVKTLDAQSDYKALDKSEQFNLNLIPNRHQIQ